MSIAIRANGDFDVSNSQAEQYAREDVDLSRSTLADMVGLAARLFRSLADKAIGMPDQRGTQDILMLSFLPRTGVLWPSAASLHAAQRKRNQARNADIAQETRLDSTGEIQFHSRAKLVSSESRRQRQSGMCRVRRSGEN